MRLLISRVKEASILIDNNKLKKMKKGLLVYVGFSVEDENILDNTIIKSVNKLINLRFFEDENQKLKKSIKDINGDIMIVSNFSLYARSKKGNTLDFSKAMNQKLANEIYDKFIENIKKEYDKIFTGEFRSDMKITSIADGPVNVILDF